MSRGFMEQDQGRSGSEMNLKGPQKEEFALQQRFLAFLRTLMLWESESHGSCLGKRHRGFQELHGPSWISNGKCHPSGSEGDRLHTQCGLRQGLVAVGGSFENSWRPTVKTGQIFFIKAQPLFNILLLWALRGRLAKGSHLHSQTPSF